MSNMQPYLQATAFFDYEHPSVQQFLSDTLADVEDSPLEQIRHLYLAVRDKIRYNPYTFSPEPHTLSASHVLATGQSYCIPKAVLLGAAARAIGVPARLGLADVKNHVSSPQLIEYLQSDIFRMHGYIELYLNEQWVKATPAFNKHLCRLMGVAPLEFDGIHDSIFHEFAEDGRRHMEYINEYGTFPDVPLDFIIKQLHEHYPHLFDQSGHAHKLHGESLEDDLEKL